MQRGYKGKQPLGNDTHFCNDNSLQVATRDFYVVQYTYIYKDFARLPASERFF